MELLAAPGSGFIRGRHSPGRQTPVFHSPPRLGAAFPPPLPLILARKQLSEDYRLLFLGDLTSQTSGLDSGNQRPSARLPRHRPAAASIKAPPPHGAPPPRRGSMTGPCNPPLSAAAALNPSHCGAAPRGVQVGRKRETPTAPVGGGGEEAGLSREPLPPSLTLDSFWFL